MKTETLINRLSANLEPVHPQQVPRIIAAAVITGSVTATALVFYAIGVRWDLSEPSVLIVVIAKLTFTVAVVALATTFLAKLARPGGENGTPLSLLSVPFIVLVLVATVGLLLQPSTYWDGMMMGERWLECLLAIPAAAVVPFAAMIWAVRQAAPTDLRRTGALIGIAAGGVSATAYALHSTEGLLPFVAIWYGSGIALCAIAGAKLGPRLLRW
ncbi:NrsF family protein [Microvirga sp. VF16]|uniref:NrsF family protein n=1 Tax=Microvirga sp. VF16 TaxID=2807101 RepID=UPI00193E3FB6|nr:DUF1109 domain-containing protein [Microvirga sp. VF16]QRM34693.1 DUF1109 domain-containing protein [Microvirga sp. VF16]